jgi:hypothetical protein
MKLFVAAPLALVLTIYSAHADVIYTYTGNDFTIANSPYTTTEKVTATVELSNPLGDSVTDVDVAPVSFVINDGQQVITNTTAGLIPSFFTFSTGPDGQIIGWEVTAQLREQDNNGILTVFNQIETHADIPSNPLQQVFDTGSLPNAIVLRIDGGCPNTGGSITGPGAINLCDQGVWITPPASVPAPSPLPARSRRARRAPRPASARHRPRAGSGSSAAAALAHKAGSPGRRSAPRCLPRG